MNMADRIHEQVQHLPERFQKDVLRFIEDLIRKSQREDNAWAEWSLRMAVTGLEDETWPEYKDADFKERWQ
jgi:hypothetical protein